MELESGLPDEDDCSEYDTQSSSESGKRSAAMFILKTAEKNILPLSSMGTLLTDISSLIANAVHQVEQKIVAAADNSSSVEIAIVHEVCSQEAITNPFLGLESTYMQTKYFRESLYLLVSGVKQQCTMVSSLTARLF